MKNDYEKFQLDVASKLSNLKLSSNQSDNRIESILLSLFDEIQQRKSIQGEFISLGPKLSHLHKMNQSNDFNGVGFDSVNDTQIKKYISQSAIDRARNEIRQHGYDFSTDNPALKKFENIINSLLAN